MRLLAMAVADAPIKEGPWEAGSDPWHRPVVLAPSNSGGDVILAQVEVAALADLFAHAHPGRMAAWLGCVARLRKRVQRGHEKDCQAYVGPPHHRLRVGDLPCTCGHEDDLAALGAVDEEKAP